MTIEVTAMPMVIVMMALPRLTPTMLTVKLMTTNTNTTPMSKMIMMANMRERGGEDDDVEQDSSSPRSHSNSSRYLEEAIDFIVIIITGVPQASLS